MPLRHLTALQPEEKKGFSNTMDQSSSTSLSWATVLPDLLASPGTPATPCRLPWLPWGHPPSHLSRAVPWTLPAAVCAGSSLPALPVCLAQLLLAFKQMWKLNLGQGIWCLWLLGALVVAKELPVTRAWSPWDRFSPFPWSKQDSSMLTPPWWRTNQEPRLGVIN